MILCMNPPLVEKEFPELLANCNKALYFSINHTLDVTDFQFSFNAQS